MTKEKTAAKLLGLDGLSPRAVAKLLKVGREFGSPSTLAQSDKTLGAIGTYGPRIEDAGFGSDDAALLSAARDGLLAAGVTRNAKQTGNKTTNKAYLSAIVDGKAKRARGRTILGNSVGLLEAIGTEEALGAEQAVTAVLSQTLGSEDDATKLATQLEALGGALAEPFVAKLMKTRGAPKAVKDLAASAVKLRTIAPQGVTQHGTPAETEKLDLLDGIIVRVCRAARKAARQIARETGEEAIATAFELSELYPPRAKPVKGGGPGGGAPGGGGP